MRRTLLHRPPVLAALIGSVAAALALAAARSVPVASGESPGLRWLRQAADHVERTALAAALVALGLFVLLRRPAGPPGGPGMGSGDGLL